MNVRLSFAAWCGVGLIAAVGCRDFDDAYRLCQQNGGCDGGSDANGLDGGDANGPGGTDANGLDGGVTQHEVKPCLSSAECSAGECVHGFCCDTTADQCTGCRACNVPGREGLCTPVPSGEDPQGLCPASVADCRLGGCDGDGGCLPQPAGTVCKGSTCDGVGTCCNQNCSGQCQSTQVTGSSCDGKSATCPKFTMSSCPGSVCGATGCMTSCETSADCDVMSYCKAGKCEWKSSNGVFCLNEVECYSGLCLDSACVRCTSSEIGCTAQWPVCDTWTCGVCSSNADCASWGGTCSGGGCTCQQALGCNNVRAPRCTGGTCVCGSTGLPCKDGQECVDSSATATCKWVSGRPCQGHADCLSGVCTAGECE